MFGESGAWGRNTVDRRRAVAVLSGQPAPHRALQLAIKHAIDRFVGLLALVAFAPFIVLVIVVIVAIGGRPVTRTAHIGQGGRTIWLYRFGKPPLAPGFGGFLARSGLEDMPMLFNVLRGDLSLIGPHPNRDPGASHAMRPGLFTPTTADGQKRSDLDDIERYTLSRDLAIARAAICEALASKRTG
ncbi:sugar transferase [Pelagibacterium xiamenense]|uniref:sugar transferase n=1 Tax=Pelagibacterium xiamenense TaxID=2901140 RepID=UPI001E4DFB12|nr:sugar transferase [Pelagibacterium xiamenense]MCD7058786.1 sugar transferase [Pelagibacterium xiamenense]